MKIRIKVSQISVGMFIDEIESGAQGDSALANSFIVESMDDINQLHAEKVMSVVIDLSKGKDVDESARFKAFTQKLGSIFSEKELGKARETMNELAPQIKDMFKATRAGTEPFKVDLADAAVQNIMASSEESARAMIALCRMKDHDEGTFLHSLAVSSLLVAFGRQLELSEEDVLQLGIGGLVHDIGKMRLPLAIVNKPGKLTPDEFNIIRHHTLLGYQELKTDPNVHETALDICLYHHEKYDGTGYPRGLKGRKIPIVARVAAICDVYDALTTVRPYKDAFSVADATKFMLKATGHFDPDLMKAFVKKMFVGGILQ